MTSRLLLTLLALLTGLSVQASPGEARVASARASEMSAVAALAGEVREDRAAGIFAIRGKATQLVRISLKSPLPLGAQRPLSDTLIGIDRSRE